MIKVLITGEKSYIGVKFKEYIARTSENILINTISLRNDSWRGVDFSEYDTILHVVGIAHLKETKKNEALYYKINRDLTHELANKAKNDGVGHFIFFSSMSVYGIESGVIKEDTVPKPISNYGKSKLQAEKLIQSLSNTKFKVSIIRPPMIYGPGCKGNYNKLSKISLSISIFPDIKNKRSMLYIDNCSEFIKLIIEDRSAGTFFPQNSEYICTTNMVKLIAQANKRTIKLTNIFNPIIKILKVSIINKVFGNLVYESKMSKYKTNYEIHDFEKTIMLTEEVDFNE